MIDPPCYPGTNVFINKLGIRDQKELLELESDLCYVRSLDLLHKPIAGAFDLTHLCAIHQYLFQDIYAWAGQIRCYAIKKGNSIFTPPEQIEFYAARIFGDLAAENHLRDYLDLAVGHPDPASGGNGRPVAERYAWFAA